MLLLISRFTFSLLLHTSKLFYRAWWRSLECPCVPLKCVFPTKICKNCFFSEKTVFLTSRCEKSSKFSVKNASLDKKTIVLLKELKKGYLPMHLSQFSFFWRKSTFLEGGGLNFQCHFWQYVWNSEKDIFSANWLLSYSYRLFTLNN